MRRLTKWIVGAVAAFVLAMIVWAVAIGPVAVQRIFAHGTTTVWDHLEYPGREISPSPDPQPWPKSALRPDLPVVELDGLTTPLESLLVVSESVAFVVLKDGELVHEWYAPNHGRDQTSMVFSVSKSVVSLMIGAAIDDGIIGSASDPVSAYIPELAQSGFDGVSLEDLLRMDSNVDYVEDDNPFGIHVQFNYTPDLTDDILALRVREEPDPTFRYKSGDNALLGLVLERALNGTTITDYFQQRLWDPLGAESGGIWSTDSVDGFERTWCCLAVTAADLARIGQLVAQDGVWNGEQLVSEEWLEASSEAGFAAERWPEEYRDSPLANYGYQWWLGRSGESIALGKNGQYIYVDPIRDIVIVRLGESPAEFSWLTVIIGVADGLAG